MMKKISLFLLLSILFIGTAKAYDFSAAAPSGQTLYFSIISGTNVKVTHPGTNGALDPYPSGFAKPTGRLVIPETVVNGGTTYTITEIKGYSFNGCDLLTAVFIPSTIANIRAYAFQDCIELDTVYVLKNTPPVLSGTGATGAFSGVNFSSVVIAVPTGTVAAYQAAAGWSDFTNIVEAGSTPLPPTPTSHTVTATANNALYGSVIGSGTYNHGTAVQLIAAAKRNCAFEQWSDGDTNNPRQLTLTADITLMANFAQALTQTVHDTMVYHDTLVYHDTIVLHDTVADTLYLHDTLAVHDTLSLHDTLLLHDTLIAYLHDTVALHDTLTAFVHDTLTLHDTLALHDTVVAYITNFVHDTIFDTVIHYLHDTTVAYVTTYVHDTVWQYLGEWDGDSGYQG